MDVINSVTTALLKYYPHTLTVLLECIGILRQFSINLTGFWKPVKLPGNAPVHMSWHMGELGMPHA